MFIRIIDNRNCYLELTMREIYDQYYGDGNTFICGALIRALQGRIKIPAGFDGIDFAQLFEWEETTKSFHAGWLELLGHNPLECSSWDSWFEDWNKYTEFDWDNFPEAETGREYRLIVLEDCAQRYADRKFLIKYRLSNYFGLKFEGVDHYEF